MTTQHCPSCMKPMRGQDHCPACGFESSRYVPAPGALPAGFALYGYEVGVLLGASRQSRVYAGLATVSEEYVLIEEFFPASVAGRAEDGKVVSANSKACFDDALQQFLAQDMTAERPWKQLDIFSAGGTGYRVYALEQGLSPEEETERLLDIPVRFARKVNDMTLAINSLPIRPLPPVRPFRDLSGRFSAPSRKRSPLPMILSAAAVVVLIGGAGTIGLLSRTITTTPMANGPTAVPLATMASTPLMTAQPVQPTSIGVPPTPEVVQRAETDPVTTETPVDEVTPSSASVTTLEPVPVVESTPLMTAQPVQPMSVEAPPTPDVVLSAATDPVSTETPAGEDVPSPMPTTTLELIPTPALADIPTPVPTPSPTAEPMAAPTAEPTVPVRTPDGIVMPEWVSLDHFEHVKDRFLAEHPNVGEQTPADAGKEYWAIVHAEINGETRKIDRALFTVPGKD